jgi:hypothetical protein
LETRATLGGNARFFSPIESPRLLRICLFFPRRLKKEERANERQTNDRRATDRSVVVHDTTRHHR